MRAGGGLGLFLGRHASPEQLAQSAPAALLGGKLRWRSREETHLRPLRYDHPVFRSLTDYAEAIPWTNFPVLKYWELESLAEGVGVICSYANGRPAILDRSVERGRVLTMTTPVSDPAHGDPWNLLPTGPDPWPFLALATGMVDYLCGARDDRLNYLVGQTAALHLHEGADSAGYVLRMPGGQAVRQSLLPGRDEVLITTTGTPGNYRLQSGGTRGGLDRGFSANPPQDVSALARADFAEIAGTIGKDRVQLARTKEEIDIRVGLGRVGRELFPWLITMLAVILGGEHLLANRFYRRE